MDRGVNFQRLFERSPYSPEVLALYKKAHLSVRDDLAALTRHANIHADRNAIQWLERTSVPSGHLQVPELDMHTIADQLVPVQQENYYRHTVDHAGSGALLRHCARRTSSARVTATSPRPNWWPACSLASQRRVTTGHWGNLATASHLNAVARSLHLGASAFIDYQPARLSGNNGPFTNRSGDRLRAHRPGRGGRSAPSNPNPALPRRN
jgi:hypothetical protein